MYAHTKKKTFLKVIVFICFFFYIDLCEISQLI